MSIIKKFKAWDKKNKVMLSWGELKKLDYTHQFELFEDDNFIFLQDTGRKDKTGKEICEGDIVVYEKGTKFVSEVRYKKTEFLPQQIKRTHYILVIGNIYENPELLNTGL